MYAVIETGGRQYRVELGSEIELDQLDAEPGSTIELGRVLLVADGEAAHIGRPVVDGARVTADVVRHDRGDKVVVFKYRPKARRRVKHGHRSNLTFVRVADIVLGERSASEDARTQADKEAAARAAAEQEAARKAAADQELAARLAAVEQAGEATDETAKPASARKRTTKQAEEATTEAEEADEAASVEEAKGAPPKVEAETATAKKPAARKAKPRGSEETGKRNRKDE